MNKIGQFIKKLRKEKGLTQSQLAEKLEGWKCNFKGLMKTVL